MRFRAADVAEFLRAWGYTVPRELARATSRSILVVGAKETANHVSRALGEAVPVRETRHAYDALIFAGSDPADVYVIDARAIGGEIDIGAMLEAIHRANAQAKFVVLSDEAIALPPIATRVGRADMQGLVTMIMPEQAEAPVGAPAVAEEASKSAAAGGSSR